MPARVARRTSLVAVLAASLLGWALLAGGSPRDRIDPSDPGPAPASSDRPRIARRGPSDPVDVFRGLGTWIDIYDGAWGHPAAAVRDMAEHGIRTLYLETSNHSRGRPFVDREGVERFLDAARRYGVSVVGWYLPGLRDVDRDLARSLDVVRMRTDLGARFDGFAMDIEAAEVRRPSARTRWLLRLSARLRRAAGPGYGLGAIVPSPLRMEVDRAYWPDFPYARLARAYDVFLPMTYFTWRVSGPAGAHAYTVGNIEIIRRETGDRSVPIHVIGGIAGDSTPAEARAFVHAVRERGAIGASYYTFPITRPSEWHQLEQVWPNPVGRPALPVTLPHVGELGNVPGADVTHPHEVVFRVDGRRGRWRLSYQAFDVQPDELDILVNWRRLGRAAPTVDGSWSGPRTVAVRGSLLRRGEPNYIAFVVRGPTGGDRLWGVRDVRLRRPGAARFTNAGS